MIKSKLVMIKPGTVIHGIGWRHEGETHTFTAADTQLRYFVQYDWTIRKNASGDLEYDWVVNYQGNSWRFENSKTAFTEIKIPAMKKEFVTLAVKGSEWEFERDWTFNGWVDYGMKQHTIPAGTRVKITDNKMRLAWYTPQEKCIVAELAPGLEVFAASSYTSGRTIAGAFIPAKEASGYLKLVTAGKTKTYWKIEDNAGNAFVDKRYADLGNVKSSLRVRFGLVQEKPDATDDEYIPEWVQYDGYDRPDTDNGVWAVQYDHATGAVLEKQDMSKFLTISFLKS